MSRRTLALPVLIAMLAVSCGSVSAPEVDFGSGRRFVPAVVDSVDDVGLGASVAVGPDGAPFVSYLAFPGPTQGQVAPLRPIGSPAVPGVFLASVSTEGVWTRGAVEQNKPSVAPAGVTIPFGPRTTENLALTADGANGTDVAVGEDGSAHLAWTAGSGVFYAKTSATSTAVVQQVFDYGSVISEAGPVGKPGIALDENGDPWVAFGVSVAEGIEIRIATPSGDGWADSVATVAGTCAGCPQPGPTGVGFVSGRPYLVFSDPGREAVRAATPSGRGWKVEDVEDPASGSGLSVTSAGDALFVSYYTGSGEVHVATFDGSTWSVASVSSSGDPENTSGLEAETTSVAVEGQGTVWVAWDDGGVRLASGDGSTFQPAETAGTQNGQHPAVAVTAEGNVYLAWYDTAGMNLMLGTLGDLSEVLLANPSPSSSVSLAPSGGAECGADGKVVLDLIAKNSLFDTTCLVAPADEDFTINLDNQDAGVPHNVNVFTEQGGDSLAATTLESGPVQQQLEVKALEAGNYYFQCDAHPTSMFGTLAVVEAKSK